MLREELELNVERARLSVEAVPDTNVLACLVKDFLRELPEPLISTSIYSMIVEAFSVALPNDPRGNRRLLLRVIDCLPAPNKVHFKFIYRSFKFSYYLNIHFKFESLF